MLVVVMGGHSDGSPAVAKQSGSGADVVGGVHVPLLAAVHSSMHSD